MRRTLGILNLALAAAITLASSAWSAPAGAPIRIGGTLALTGPLAQTGIVHKIAGEVYVEYLNKRNGLLGRPVEYVLRDDQSRPDLARTLYEQLVTVDKVDLLIGPYATGAILSAMAVAQRYNKVLLHSTMGLPDLAKYDMQFSTSGGTADINVTWPTLIFDAVAMAPKPPKTVAFVTSKFPSTHFVTAGARELAKKRGLQEVLYLEYDFGNRDFGPIANRIKEAKADLVFAGAIGLDGNLLLDAMKKIDYLPPMHSYLFPSSAPLAVLPEGRNALALTSFEEHPPFTTRPGAPELLPLYRLRAVRANLPDANVDLQAANGMATWQVLDAAVHGTKGLNDKAIAQWLKKNSVDAINGTLRWDGRNNFSSTELFKVRQVQNGRWVVIWPREFAAPGTKLIGPT